MYSSREAVSISMHISGAMVTLSSLSTALRLTSVTDCLSPAAPSTSNTAVVLQVRRVQTLIYLSFQVPAALRRRYIGESLPPPTAFPRGLFARVRTSSCATAGAAVPPAPHASRARPRRRGSRHNRPMSAFGPLMFYCCSLLSTVRGVLSLSRGL